MAMTVLDENWLEHVRVNKPYSAALDELLHGHKVQRPERELVRPSGRKRAAPLNEGGDMVSSAP
jgi:hypothetical protein